MNYRFAVEWLKAFRDSSETVCKLYADDCLFEDLMLGMESRPSKAAADIVAGRSRCGIWLSRLAPRERVAFPGFRARR